jgi:hypothetical protein
MTPGSGSGMRGRRLRLDRTSALRTPPVAWPLRILSVLSACVGAAACELQEVAFTEVDDLVVAEVLVQVRDDRAFDTPRVIALLHRTSGAPEGVRGATVMIRTPRGVVRLVQDVLSPCAWSAPPSYGATCYGSSDDDEALIAPGDALDLEITLPDGGRLTGFTRVPGDFRLTGAVLPMHSSHPCRLAPATNFDLEWTPSAGAWAYVAETALEDLQAGFAAQGIEVPNDYLYLLGLAISGADTTIVFPREFGLMERLSVGRDLALALQRGLPVGARGRVSVAAVERNYTNWARGGTFNPSGQVRIPSVLGDGTGFFGATVVRRMTVVVPPAEGWGAGETLPPCG